MNRGLPTTDRRSSLPSQTEPVNPRGLRSPTCGTATSTTKARQDRTGTGNQTRLPTNVNQGTKGAGTFAACAVPEPREPDYQGNTLERTLYSKVAEMVHSGKGPEKVTFPKVGTEMQTRDKRGLPNHFPHRIPIPIRPHTNSPLHPRESYHISGNVSTFLFATLLHLPAGFVVSFISFIENIHSFIGYFLRFIGFFIGCGTLAVPMQNESGTVPLR